MAGIEPGSYSFDGTIIYTSYNPRNPKDRKFYHWITTWLDRQPGITVRCLERQTKYPPKCPSCHSVIEYCPNPECKKKMIGTVEKGVDTYIVTDMIRLAWEEAYDIAVIASSDSDLVPAVEFLDLKGRRIIHAGFPPQGMQLSSASWASFNVLTIKSDIEAI